MDQTFVDTLAERKIVLDELFDGTYKFNNEETGELEFMLGGERSFKYTIRPIQELFLSGAQAEPSSIDWAYDRYLLLLETIEQAIVNYDEDTDFELRDGLVTLSLDRLILNCAADTRGDPLARRIQVELRLLLSLSEYSRYEVKMALRKIAKSVNLHTSVHGIRGYLDFIEQYL